MRASPRGWDFKQGMLADLVVSQNFNRDETVVLEGDDSVQALYLIASGSVQVYMTGVDGRETILSFLERGDFFGEMSLIDGEPRSASVRTVTDAQMLIIHRESFLKLIRQSPEIAMGLLSELSKRLRKANRQIGSLSTMSVSGRVAGTLLNLMEERGVRIHTDNGSMVTVIHNRPTQQQLADMSGTTRETVSRICSLLVKTNAIAMTGKDIVIFDEGALQEKATKG